MQNPDIARLFDEVADLLEIQDANPFRVRAYRNAARTIRDFPEPITDLVRAGIGQAQVGERRMLLNEAETQATAVVAYLQAGGGIGQIEVAGSYRRRRETIGDLDIVVTSEGKNSTPVMDRFVAYGDVANVISKGETRATVKLRGGLQVDLRAVEPDAYGAALLYLTGSQAPNLHPRKLAQEKSSKLNEYGLFK